MKTVLRLIPDYHVFPLGAITPHGYESLDGPELGLSPQLIEDITAWGDEFTAVLHRGWQSKEARKNFAATGYRLVDRLRAETKGKYAVEYFDEDLGREVTIAG
ncbi:MAG TPA: hypothetical protein VK983_05145 [Candidatus Limnocylindrales bacterium]|nr:hypothetical protein [Candidatus Limnocylindrales bacterium]